MNKLTEPTKEKILIKKGKVIEEKYMGRLFVDEALLEEIGNCIGAERGDPNYVYEFDINQDGVIDIYDLSWFSQRVGQYVEVPQPQPTWVSLLPLVFFGGLVLFLLWKGR